MPNKLKVLSGKEVIKIFEKFGFLILRTNGSHVSLKYKTKLKEMHTTIPLHKELKKGTLKNIVKDFEFCFGLEKCNHEFYNK